MEITGQTHRSAPTKNVGVNISVHPELNFGIAIKCRNLGTMEIDRKKQKVAFYNIFSGIDKNGEEINYLKSENYFFFFFFIHPESILTQNGLEILSESLEELVK